MHRFVPLLLLLSACAKRPPAQVEPVDPVTAQQERAAVPGADQTLERARLVSMALAVGDTALAEATLRQIVPAMQDFRADGQFRAMVGQETRKEWKGDPFEKMMAFLYLGTLLLEQGDYGNALAMSKSAILADTGTSRHQYRADFVAGFVLQALAYDAQNEQIHAERAISHAVDALYVRALTEALSAQLDSVSLPAESRANPAEESAARALLQAALPAGLHAHPRDPEAAIDGALGRATDLRGMLMTDPRKRWPSELQRLQRADCKNVLPTLSLLSESWRDAVRSEDADPVSELADDAAFLRSLVGADAPRLLLWVEAGRAPAKRATGTYGQLLQLSPYPAAQPPEVTLDGRPLPARLLDSMAFQATTRGSRGVDAFLRGKAVFKDTSTALGWALVVAGDIAHASEQVKTEGEENSALDTALYAAGAAAFLVGALTNPRADTRAWDDLPDTLWLLRADPAPGVHRMTVGGIEYEVQIPDAGTVHHLVVGRPPGGVRAFGTPCTACVAAPLAIPAGAPR